MKKLLTICISGYMMCVSLVGCERDTPMWDFTCYDIPFVVTDATGEFNLLDPATVGNILDQPIKVVMHGQEFPMVNGELHRRAVMPMPLPLALRHCRHDRFTGKQGAYRLFFGQFSPVDNHRQESFTIVWGDGTQDEVKFNYFVIWDEKKPILYQDIWLNGVKVAWPERTSGITIKKTI